VSSRDAKPMKKTSDLNSRQIRCRVFSITRGDPPPLFQAQKGVFDQVTHFVEMLVIIPRLLSVFSRRNNRGHVFLTRQVQDILGVVAFVGNQKVRRDGADQGLSLRTICSGTRCNKYSDRIAMRIHGQMYLRVEPPFVRPISWLPPLAPVACW